MIQRFTGARCWETLPLHRLSTWSWAIKWKDRAGFLGMCLLRPLEGTDWTCIGWRFVCRYWGQGIATEAARPILAHASRVPSIDPVVAIVDPRNLASLRVAEKIGLRRAGTAYHYGTEQVLFFERAPRTGGSLTPRLQ